MSAIHYRLGHKTTIAYIVFLLFFAVIAFKTFVYKNVIVTLLPSIALLLGALFFSSQKRGRVYVGSIINKNVFYLYAFYILLMVICTMRSSLPSATLAGNLNDVTILLSLNLYAYVCFSYFFRKNESTNALSFALLGPLILIYFAVVYYITHYSQLPSVDGSFRSKPLFLTLLGFDVETKIIQFKDGTIKIHPNTFGIIGGALLSAYWFSIKTYKLSKLTLSNLAIFFSLIALVTIADSRVTILNIILTFALLQVLVYYKKLNVLPWIAVFFPFFPFVSLYLLELIANTDLAMLFSKNDGSDIASGSERATIWYYCFEELKDFKPIHLIGFGDYGHYGAGTSSLYYKVVFGPDGDEAVVTHNAFYQAFFDIGYLGVIIYLTLLYKVAKSAIFLYRQQVDAARIYLGFITYYILSGAFESTFGSYNKIYNFIFMLVFIAVLTHKNAVLKQHKLQATLKTRPSETNRRRVFAKN